MKYWIFFLVCCIAPFELYSAPHPLSELTRAFTLLSPQSTHTTVPHTLKPIAVHQDVAQEYHIHLQQYYQSIPVYRGYLIIHSRRPYLELLRNPKFPVEVTGKLLQLNQQELSDPPPDFITQAPAVLEQFNRTILTVLKGNILQADILPIIYVDLEQHPHWAYQIKLQIQNNNEVPTHPITLIDAVSKKPYLSWDNIQTLKVDAMGLGYGGNLKTGTHQYGQERPPLSIKRDEDKQLCYLENKQAKIVDMHQRYTQTSSIFNFPCLKKESTLANHYWTGILSDGYDTVNESYSPSNDALYYASIVKELYNEWYHVEPLYTPSGQAQRLILRVHYGQKFNNAFWDGKTLTFGDGDDRTFYSLVSLAITAHEISHGFTQQHSNLEYTGQSGAINEAFSDMAGITAEQYANYKLTWILGEDILKPGTSLQAVRYFEHPSLDGKSFETLHDYLQAEKESPFEPTGINVHHGSGIFNRLFYLIATHPDWSVQKAFDVMVHANMNYWTPYSDFQDAACGILLSTQQLHYPISTVQNALDEVGIDWHRCK